jgi:hypothetical protein
MADDDITQSGGAAYISDSEQERHHKELISRLKQEGQLTRNTGTNSLKSVKLEFGKFDDVLTAMRENLTNQTIAINDLLEVQKVALDLEMSEIERQKKKDELAKVGKTVSGQDDKKGSDDKKSKKPKPGMIGDFIGRIGPGLGALIGAGLAGTASMLSHMRLGGLILRAIPLVTLAPLIGDFIGDFVGSGLADLGASPEVTEQMRETFNKAGRWGAIGAIFGRKGAAIGFFAGALSSFGSSLLERFGIGEDEDISILGLNVNALAGTETILAALGGTLALLAPSLLKLTGKLLLGAITGPVGIAALTGAALVGTVALVNNWLEKRRDRLIGEMEEKTAEGFAAINEVESEEDTGFLRRLGLSLGAKPQTVTEELDVFRRQVEGAAEVTGMGDFGSPESRAVLDPERRKSLQDSMENILTDVESLDNLSKRNLLDLKSIADLLQMKDRSSELSNALERKDLQITVRQLESQKLELTQGMGLSEQDPRVMDINRIINDKKQMIVEKSEVQSFNTGSKGFQDFGSGSFAMLHGIEAVVPRQTPAGEMIATMFDENFEPRFEVNSDRMSPVLEQISSSAHNVINNIVFAPTSVSPVTSIQQGGSTVSSVTQNSLTSFGGGNGGSGLGRFAN